MLLQAPLRLHDFFQLGVDQRLAFAQPTFQFRALLPAGGEGFLGFLAEAQRLLVGGQPRVADQVLGVALGLIKDGLRLARIEFPGLAVFPPEEYKANRGAGEAESRLPSTAIFASNIISKPRAGR